MIKEKDNLIWLKPKNDFVFKLLFGENHPISKQLLLCFLNDLFRIPNQHSLATIQIHNPRFEKQFLQDKASILDIRAQIPGDSLVNIEIQLKNSI